MGLYNGPESGGYYRGKFIRVERRIFVSNRGDIQIPHKALAHQAGIVEEIERLRIENPSEVDAGQYGILREEERYGGDQVNVHGDSSGLQLPVTNEARSKTIVDFGEQTPGFTINSLGDLKTYSKD